MSASLPPTRDEFAALARKVFGEPNKALSSRNELRFGTNGSKSVDLSKLTWYDHEEANGGGYVELRRLAGEWPPSGSNGSHSRDFHIPQGMLRELGNPVAMWDYHDQHGNIVARAVRFELEGSKTFRQCRPNGSGWVWKTKDIQIPLYRLSEVLAAPPSAPIFIVEGERKADALRNWVLRQLAMSWAPASFASTMPTR